MWDIYRGDSVCAIPNEKLFAYLIARERIFAEDGKTSFTTVAEGLGLRVYFSPFPTTAVAY